MFDHVTIEMHDCVLPKVSPLVEAAKRTAQENKAGFTDEQNANLNDFAELAGGELFILTFNVRGEANRQMAAIAVKRAVDAASRAERRKLVDKLLTLPKPVVVATKPIAVTENEHARPGRPLYERFLAAWRSSTTKTVELVFHGTLEANVDAILKDSLDPGLRGRKHGQAHGPGEYFGLTFQTSLNYIEGGRKMLVFAVLSDPIGVTYRDTCMLVVHRIDFQLPLFVVHF